MTIAAIIVAAGRGTRAGGDIPKQWQRIAGRTVLDWTLDRFRTHPLITKICLVVHPEDIERAAHIGGVTIALGGATRNASVRNGLEALYADPPQLVLIHDVARPCCSHNVIDAVIDALGSASGAAPALAVTDALWRGENSAVIGTHPRDGLFRAQTPQGFDFSKILDAHRAHVGDAADDVAVARAAGLGVAIVLGDENNLKITTPEDFRRAENILLNMTKGPQMDVRLGNGYDVHRFGDGDHVMICGVKIAHSRALQGHSDADVAMHAITDALYGALSQGDIGRHFPPSNPQWKGAASEIFLKHAADLIKSMGYSIGNIDCTIVCEYPKIGPHAAAMQSELARIIGIDPTRISVKATTSERLGFTGREEGIAALATATVLKP